MSPSVGAQVARMSRRCHSWTICISTMRRALMHYRRKWQEAGWIGRGWFGQRLILQRGFWMIFLPCFCSGVAKRSPGASCAIYSETDVQACVCLGTWHAAGPWRKKMWFPATLAGQPAGNDLFSICLGLLRIPLDFALFACCWWISLLIFRSHWIKFVCWSEIFVAATFALTSKWRKLLLMPKGPCFFLVFAGFFFLRKRWVWVHFESCMQVLRRQKGSEVAKETCIMLVDQWHMGLCLFGLPGPRKALTRCQDFKCGWGWLVNFVHSKESHQCE